MSDIRYINVINSAEAWKRLASVKLSPATAYKIFKYMRNLDDEFKLFEKQKMSAARDAAGVEEGDFEIKPGTAEHCAYVEKLNELLAVRVDLDVIDASLEELVSENNCEISVSDISVLEPFFGGDDGASAN